MTQIGPESEFRTPVSAYVSAVISFLFVTFLVSSYLAATTLVAFPGVNTRTNLQLVLVIVGIYAVLSGTFVGGLSAWSAFRLARRSAYERFLQRQSAKIMLPAWRREVVIYPAGIVSGALAGIIIGVTSGLRGPEIVFAAMGGMLGGGLISAVILTMAREFTTAHADKARNPKFE